MKKFMVALIGLMLVPFVGEAQGNANSIKDFHYYGIDFTQVKVVGALESTREFLDVFTPINRLVLSEYKKFNPEKHLKRTMLSSNIEMIEAQNDKMNGAGLFSTDLNLPDISQEKIKEIISDYDLSDNEGIGLVVFAKEFNKGKNVGVYQFIFFDIATREIVYAKTVSGRAKGFGLRNYWANSYYEVLKGWRW